MRCLICRLIGQKWYLTYYIHKKINSRSNLEQERGYRISEDLGRVAVERNLDQRVLRNLEVLVAGLLIQGN